MRPYLFVLFVFILLTTEIQAQLVAQFSADTTRHCAPKGITFRDLSSGGSTIVYRKWEFGNGGVSNSNDPNPSRLYTSAGSYTVSLTVSDGTDTARIVKQNYIRIFANPSADFSSTALNQCVPKRVRFTENSSLGSAPINAWEWDFGDLSPKQRSANPTHAYQARGSYSVSLTVTDTNGCFATVSKTNHVLVESPTAHFIAAGNRSDCQAPLSVSFTNQSSNGNGSLSYQWAFGDGNTSTQRNPSNTYSSAGQFTVRLIATDTAGCKDTITRVNYVNIGTTRAQFAIKDTLCKGAFDTLVNNSIGANTFSWDFGNGQSSSQRDPVVSYASSGFFSIRLIASAGSSCIDTLTKTVYVESVLANFSIDTTDFCQSPARVQVSDSSSANATKWNFSYWPATLYASFNYNDPNDGALVGSSSAQNPVFNIKLPVKIPSRPRIKRGEFNFQLIVTTAAGCKDSLVKNNQVRIWEPDVYILTDSTKGCISFQVPMRDSTASQYPIVKWEWDYDRFANDTSDTSGLRTVIYNQSGAYFANIKVTDSLGCVAFDTIKITAGQKMNPQVSFVPDSLCMFETLKLANITFDTLGLRYGYNFTDGAGFESTRDTVFFQAKLDTGWIDLTMTSTHYQCQSINQFYGIAYVKGPVIEIGAKVDCSDPSTADFIPIKWKGVQRWLWGFGDGAVDSLNRAPRHTYASPAAYSYSLKAINDSTGCQVTLGEQLGITGLKAVIDVQDTLFCSPVEDFSVSGANSVGVFGNRYSWNFGNGDQKFFNPRPLTDYLDTGLYTIRLIVLDGNSCLDTAYRSIRAYNFQPQVLVQPSAICEADTLYMRGLSQSPVGIEKTYWYLDNVLIDSSLVYRDSLFYIDSIVGLKQQILSQTRDFKYEVVDSLGCTKERSLPLEIRRLQIGPKLSDSSLCENNRFGGIDTIASAFAQHIWSFGNGDHDTNYLFNNYLYDSAGTYNLSLRVIDTAGCEKTDTIVVNMEHIKNLGFNVSNRDSTCYPMEVYFSDTSIANNLVNRAWTFGDGSSPVNTLAKDSVRKIYNFPGLFDVKLVLTTANGCKDSVEYAEYIQITGPYANVRLVPDSSCIGDTVFFVLDSVINVANINWDFGDGNVFQGGAQGDSIKHVYDFTGRFNTIMLYTDSIGTCSRFEANDIVVNSLNSFIVVEPDTQGCVPLRLNFKDSIKAATQWNWIFGSEGNATGDSLSFEFQIPDTHKVLLAVFNENTGCRDTSEAEIVVFPLPEPAIESLERICRWDTVAALAIGQFPEYEWQSSRFFENSDSSFTRFYPDSSMFISLSVRDSNACRATVTKAIEVIQKPSLLSNRDTSIIIGEDLSVDMQSDQTVNVQWTPASLFECPSCPNTLLRTLKDTTVCIRITDLYNCFTVDTCFRVLVEGKYSLDLPESFSPNGDGVNDVLYIRGWGIESLLEWKIYNRWGELVFETNDLNLGWDGSHKGSPQNMETFSYLVRVKNYAGEEMHKAGFVTLVR